MYALVFALALALAGCSKDTPTSPAPKVNPGSDGVTSPPGLFLDPGELPAQGLNTLEQPDKYDAAADVLWGSILGTEKKDMALVRALDGVRVLISGVVEIDGKEQLYLGIDRADFARHDIENLRAVLETRFPAIPIFIEASDGIDLLAGNETDEETAVDVFSDTFSAGLGAWKTGSGWQVQTFAYPVPGETDGNKVAVATSAGCAGTCSLTTKPIDLSGYSSATLSLHRWLDDALDAGDTFVVEVGNDGVYRTVGSYDSDDGDDVWHYNTFTLDEQHLGEKTTVRITATLPSAFNLFDLFNSDSGDDTEAQTMALDNVLVRGTQTADTSTLPNLTVHSVSADSETVDSGTQVKVRYSVKNAGTATAGKETVSIYRHYSETDTPATGGRQVSTFEMQSPLAPGSGFGRATDIKVPFVSEDTAVYYYVCVSVAEGETQTDDNCGAPAAVTVSVKAVETPTEEPEEEPVETPAEEPDSIVTETPTDNNYTETSYPEPPYESCYHSPERKYVMGGDAVLPQHIDGDGVYMCGTLTLAGVEAKDGTKGFVTAGHTVFAYEREHDPLNFLKTDTVLGHGTYMKTYDMGRLIGKVHTMPSLEHIETANYYSADADAAFVAYPRPNTADCSLTWTSNGETFCLDLNGDQQIDRAVPMKIRGKGREVYTVTGSYPVTAGTDVWITGAVSGVREDGQIPTQGRMSQFMGGFAVSGTVGTRVNTLHIEERELIPGDSGSPIYTVPDRDGNVRIVGIAVGVAPINGVITVTFSSWDVIEKALDLKPID